MNAKRYFEVVVAPLYEWCKADPDAIDLQFAASVVTYHIVDYLAIDGSCTPAEARLAIEKDCPKFNALYGVATARKHSVVQQPSSDFVGLSAAATLKRTFIKIGGKLATINGKMAVLGPTVKLAGGGTVSISVALDNSVAYLKTRFSIT